MERKKYTDHAQILNRRRYVSVIMKTLLGIIVLWKLQMNPYVTSDSTNGKKCYMYKYVKNTKAIWRYMEDL